MIVMICTIMYFKVHPTGKSIHIAQFPMNMSNSVESEVISFEFNCLYFFAMTHFRNIHFKQGDYPGMK